MKPVLIQCIGGNPRLAKIAIDAGFEYGARLPTTVYFPLFFADQNWKDPNRELYMKAVAEHKPEIGTVLDWEEESQLAEVLDWAEEIAQFVNRVVIIPKVIGGIPRIPRTIGAKQVVLGYSVPTRYGGTPLPLWSFAGWPVHLLGGAPKAQINVYLHLRGLADVVSVDGNYSSMKALRYCAYWDRERFCPVRRRDGEMWGHDAPYEAFRRSCRNLMATWERLQ